ncbi:NPCBM/NEW2 domain-containing protein [Kibdelosporangium phytohabitans]|uniref:NPCBM/NEW2 domain-containing protein n=1 Tax=Kibdelosporangium phytohabitans TaxID=860235 RepID=UPI0019E547A3|nr:NPCBM/NEW2 domain-containing protein [Kibdelosporangium phytohabitans]MBE1464309.1 hypothetical protein [Kibdelosporangium phytohabitans]
MELDTSNGDTGPGDGPPIVIGGVKYAKGLGAHAPSVIEYYTDSRCTSVTADVGIDDGQGTNGTGTFEIWADGRKVTDSATVTNQMPAKALSADVTGATFVRLVTTDAGDNKNYDHTDWGNARITCS